MWVHTLDLARGLAKHGVRTTLATMGKPISATQRAEAKSIPGLDLYTSEYRTETMLNPWEDVNAAGSWLLALADRVRPDIVHLNHYSHASLPWNVPTVVSANGDLVSRCQAISRHGAYESVEYARRVQGGLRSASMVVAPNAATLADLERNFGPIPASRVICQARRIDVPEVGGKRNMILSVGSVGNEAKNLNMLQRTARSLDWPIYIAGNSGNQRNPQMRGVSLLGRQSSSALNALYSRASIFALPAKYDPMGTTVQEAAQFGCALVLGDIPAYRELWDGAAIFVAPDDEGELAEALRLLQNDRHTLDALAASARRRAESLSPTTTACEHLFTYQDVLQGDVFDLPRFSML